MSPAERREMIVAAALPLLVEHGATVSTAQIAKAAGIGEATIFRAFTDKDELLDACVAAALRNDHVLAELDAVPLDQPLAARLTEAAATLHAYLDRMGAVIGAVHAAGRRAGRGAPRYRTAPGNQAAASSDRATRSQTTATSGRAAGDQATADEAASTGDRAAATERTRQAVIRLLEPDRAVLRLPVEGLADVFLGMLFGRRGVPGGETPIETLVDVFLHGVVSGPAMTSATARTPGMTTGGNA